MKSGITFKIAGKALSDNAAEKLIKRVLEANLEKLDMDVLFTERTNETSAA